MPIIAFLRHGVVNKPSGTLKTGSSMKLLALLEALEKELGGIPAVVYADDFEGLATAEAIASFFEMPEGSTRDCHKHVALCENGTAEAMSMLMDWTRALIKPLILVSHRKRERDMFCALHALTGKRPQNRFKPGAKIKTLRPLLLERTPRAILINTSTMDTWLVRARTKL